jgi:hypothetical protein
MKSYQSSIKQNTEQRERRRYKMEKPKSWQMKNPPKKVDLRNLEQIKYLFEV